MMIFRGVDALSPRFIPVVEFASRLAATAWPARQRLSSALLCAVQSAACHGERDNNKEQQQDSGDGHRYDASCRGSNIARVWA